MSWLGNTCKLFEQLRQCLLWVDDNGFHCRQRLQRIIDAHSIKYPEGRLANFWAETSCSPEHLVVQNSAIDASHKNEVDDLWDINASCQQINGYGNIWQSVIPEPTDQLRGVIDAARNL